MEKLNYYMSLPYRIEVVPDADEGGFALYCPELPGCMTCADTIEDGYRMLKDAKVAWFLSCIENGIAIPEPQKADSYSGQFKLRIPKVLHRQLAETSREQGVSMNQYCSYLLAKGCGMTL